MNINDLDLNAEAFGTIRTARDAINQSIAQLQSKCTEIQDTRTALETLAEHPRHNGLLKIDPLFYVPGQIQACGEVLLSRGGYKIGVTTKQACAHLDRELEQARKEIELLEQEKRNLCEKIKVASQHAQAAAPVSELRFGDTVGKVFQCGDFFEIIETEVEETKSSPRDDDVAAGISGMTLGEKPKRVARVKNEEERAKILSNVQI